MLETLGLAVLIGLGGTVLLDVWNLLLNRTLGQPLPPWHLIGRWFAGLPRGQLVHRQGISSSAPVRGELAIGWCMHYVVGISFALVLLLIWGLEWAAMPTFGPALLVGLVTVGAGWFILQPGLGVGVACSNAPNPGLARMNNVVGHVVFALGMYLAARLFTAI